MRVYDFGSRVRNIGGVVLGTVICAIHTTTYPLADTTQVCTLEVAQSVGR